MKVVICFLITLLVLMYFYIYYYLQVFRNNKCVFFVSQVSTNTNWDFVNKIIYINLEERTDRRQEIVFPVNVLTKMQIFVKNNINL